MAGVFLEFSGSGAFFADLDIGTELFMVSSDLATRGVQGWVIWWASFPACTFVGGVLIFILHI